MLTLAYTVKRAGRIVGRVRDADDAMRLAGLDPTASIDHRDAGPVWRAGDHHGREGELQIERVIAAYRYARATLDGRVKPARAHEAARAAAARAR